MTSQLVFPFEYDDWRLTKPPTPPSGPYWWEKTEGYLGVPRGPWFEVITTQGEICFAHYACDLSGEEQPPFEGFFSRWGTTFHEITFHFWRPLPPDHPLSTLPSWNPISQKLQAQRNPYLGPPLLNTKSESSRRIAPASTIAV